MPGEMVSTKTIAHKTVCSDLLVQVHREDVVGSPQKGFGVVTVPPIQANSHG